MTHIQQFQRELEREAVTTRKMLSIVPTEKFDWQPHPKSMTIRSLATHIAELPLWIDMVLKTSELDFAAEPYNPKVLADTRELVDYFEQCLVTGREALAHGDEAAMNDEWTLRNGSDIYSKDPKRDVLRMTMNQITHHRAQLGVYLRLLDIPIPGSYGPSADDASF